MAYLKYRSINPEITSFRFVSGIAIGLGYAFSLYALFILVREAYRIFSLSPWHELVVLSGQEVRFYNLFFAFVSVIFGQSVCLVHWTDKPKRLFSPGIRYRRSIVNDQRNLLWFFLFWFTALAATYGLYFYVVMYGPEGGFSFYPHYRYVFVLAVIVLFLHSWTTVRLSFKRRSRVWMPLAAVIVSAVSVAFSFITIVDYQSVNKALLRKNIYHSYTLQVPALSGQSGTYSHRSFYGNGRDRVNDIFMAFPKEQDTPAPAPLVFVDGKEIPLEKTGSYIDSAYAGTKKITRALADVLLHIHKDVPMSDVNRLLGEIKSSVLQRLYFRGSTPGRESQSRVYYTGFVPYRTWQHITTPREYQASLGSLNEIQNIIGINQLDDGNYLVDGKYVPATELREVLYRRVVSEKDYIVVLFINDAAGFGSFLHVLDNLHSVIAELRDIYSLALHGKPFHWDSNTVSGTYPVRFVGITEGAANPVLSSDF